MKFYVNSGSYQLIPGIYTHWKQLGIYALTLGKEFAQRVNGDFQGSLHFCLDSLVFRNQE